MNYEAFQPPGGSTFAEKLYQPLTEWILLKRPRGPRTVIVGVNGPQGAGKSTLCRELVGRLTTAGANAISISIDDFYLTRKEQEALAAANPENKYWQQRGYPGTHDLKLALSTFRKFLRRERGFKIPTYDKSAFEGRGDRAPEDTWTEIKKAPDFVFLEGWFTGFMALGPSHPKPDLVQVDARLIGYEELWSFFDLFIFLDPLEHQFVIDWRIEAEKNMKAAGKSGMSREEAEKYVRLFLPAYEAYLPGLRLQAPNVRAALRVRIAKDRSPE
ncbi:MAG: hypothetical protein ABL958_11935 [Bdellovibrionia bacterium]